MEADKIYQPDERRPHWTRSDERRVLETLFSVLTVGELCSYESMSRAIGKDIRTCSHLARSARDSVLSSHQIALEAVPGKGYVRRDFSEVLRSTNTKTEHRSLNRQLRKLTALAPAEMTPKEALAFSVNCLTLKAGATLPSSIAQKKLAAAAEQSPQGIDFCAVKALFEKKPKTTMPPWVSAANRKRSTDAVTGRRDGQF